MLLETENAQGKGSFTVQTMHKGRLCAFKADVCPCLCIIILFLKKNKTKKL